MGIYDKRYHLGDHRLDWTVDEIMENERMMNEEIRAPKVYSNDRLICEQDYSKLMAELAPKIPPSLCSSVFLKKVIMRKIAKWLVG